MKLSCILAESPDRSHYPKRTADMKIFLVTLLHGSRMYGRPQTIISSVCKWLQELYSKMGVPNY